MDWNDLVKVLNMVGVPYVLARETEINVFVII